MRLVAAFMVLCSHQFPLNGLQEPAIANIDSWGGFGVVIFFALSGYLNAQSLFRSRSAGTFIVSRAFRILPGLFVCVVFCILLGALVTTYDLGRYFLPEPARPFMRETPLSFLLHNATLLFGMEYKLPGVFQGNPYNNWVNGSLWTLPYEAKFYLILAAIGLAVCFNATRCAVLFLAVLVGLAIFGAFYPLTPLMARAFFYSFGTVFVAGACAALIESRWNLTAALGVCAALIVAFVVFGNVKAAIFIGVVAGCLVFNLLPLPKFLQPRLDISYGVYLYAWPVQQAVSRLGMDLWLNFALVVVIVTALAVLSALLVERPMLNWRKTLARTPTAPGTVTVRK